MVRYKSCTIHCLDMLYGAMPRLLVVSGLIWLTWSASHTASFLVGVVILYLWKAIKYEWNYGEG